MINVKINPKKIFVALLCLAVVQLIIYSITDSYLRSSFFSGSEGVRSFLELFDMDKEMSIPTWYSQFLFVIAALSCFWAGLASKMKKTWWSLACVLLYLSIDDGAAIHERLGFISNKFIPAEGIFTYSWTAAALVLLVFIGLAFLRFYLRLPKRTKILFVLALGVFVIGAVGFEMIASYYSGVHVKHPPTYIIALEEFLEIFGITIFIFAVLDHLRLQKDEKTDLRLSIEA